MAIVYTRGGHSFNVTVARDVVLDTMVNTPSPWLEVDLKSAYYRGGTDNHPRHISILKSEIVAVEQSG